MINVFPSCECCILQMSAILLPFSKDQIWDLLFPPLPNFLFDLFIIIVYFLLISLGHLLSFILHHIFLFFLIKNESIQKK